MLALLRKHAQSLVIQFIVVLIAVVFIFWGVGSNLGNKRSLVAKINKREISLKDFNAAYERTLENYRTQFGGSLPPGFIDNLNLKDQVLNQLIRRELLLQGADEIGILISDFAVQEKIKAMPSFQNNDRFDIKRYKEILIANKLSTTGFENGMRSDMLTERVVEVVNEFAVVPQREIDSFLNFRNEEIRFDYVAFKKDDFSAKVEIDDESLKKWFTVQGDKYQTPRQIRLKYLEFNYNEQAKTIQPSDEEVAARYEKDKERYVTAEQRHARHILLKVDKDALPEVREAQKKKSEEVMRLAREGQDFVELAKQYSEGPTKDKGGDLGFFSRGRMVPAFEEATFALHEGEVSEVVESPFGYHVIKLEAIQPEVVRPLDAVKEQIRTAISMEQAKGATLETASVIFKAIMNAGNLANFAKENDYPIKETDFFTKDNAPTDLPSDPKFLETASGLSKGGLSSLVELQQGYAIIFAEDSRPPQTPEFEAVREQVVKDYTSEKSAELARLAANEFLKSSGASSDLQSAVTDSAMQVLDSGYLQRSNPTSNPAVPYQLSSEVLSNGLDRDMPDAPVTMGDTFYVYRITDRRIPENKMDEQELTRTKEQLLSQSKNRILNAWVAMLEERAVVWVNKTIIQ